MNTIDRALYRGKTLDENPMWITGFYDGSTAINGIVVHTIKSSGDAYGRVDPATVGQWTGLTDKNGAKIFEGDINKRESLYKIRYTEKGREEKVKSPSWNISKIVFFDGAFMKVIVAQENSYFGELPSSPKRIFRPEEYSNIIGNIHDNPELMEKE